MPPPGHAARARRHATPSSAMLAACCRLQFTRFQPVFDQRRRDAQTIMPQRRVLMPPRCCPRQSPQEIKPPTPPQQPPSPPRPPANNGRAPRGIMDTCPPETSRWRNRWRGRPVNRAIIEVRPRRSALAAPSRYRLFQMLSGPPPRECPL